MDIQFFQHIFLDIAVIEGDPSDIPTRFRQQFGITDCKRNIRKTRFDLEFCCNCETQKDIKRNMGVKDDFIDQILETMSKRLIEEKGEKSCKKSKGVI